MDIIEPTMKMNEDTLRLVIWMLIGDGDDGEKVTEYDFLFVGRLGAVSKLFLTVTRERHIWERFYCNTFPPNPIPLTSKHQGDCTYNRCKVGYNRYRYSRRNELYNLSEQGYIMIQRYGYHNTLENVPTKIRCHNHEHYDVLDLRSKNTHFKDMFKQSAKRYHTVLRQRTKNQNTSNYNYTRMKWKKEHLDKELKKLEEGIAKFDLNIKIRDNLESRFAHYKVIPKPKKQK